MKRLAVTVGATVAGTVAVLVHRPALERVADAGHERLGAAAAASVREGAAALGGTAQDPAGGQEPSGTPDPDPLEWVDGPMVDTPAGGVQVSVGLRDGELRDVRLMRGPHGTRHSAWLTRHAATVLRAEVLQAGAADVDMISGATYTSAGYLRSLQAALDAAEGR